MVMLVRMVDIPISGVSNHMKLLHSVTFSEPIGLAHHAFSGNWNRLHTLQFPSPQITRFFLKKLEKSSKSMVKSLRHIILLNYDDI